MSKLFRCVLAMIAVYLWPVILLSGCNAPKSHLTKFNQYIESGNVEQAQLFAEEKIHEKGNPRGEDLLWTLQLGSIRRFQNNFDQSSQHFDSSEDMMTHFDGENSGLGHTVGSVAVNDNVVPYTGQVYDGVMVNTYKALNFMATGQPDLARVEFNRALDRQRRAKENFNKEIQQLRDQKSQDQNSAMAQQTMNNPEFQNRIQTEYSSIGEFAVYPDFVNPLATYAAGIFFTIEKDYPKAIDLLKESAGMLPQNIYVVDDFTRLEKHMRDGGSIEPTVWVIYENGLGPIKTETRIDLPLFIATDNVRYFGIALPKLAFRPSAAPFLDIQAASQTHRTQLLVNMDSVIKTEFDKDFQGILTRAIISATTKAIAQYSLEKNQNSSTAAVIAAIYSFATTAADVRIWTMLPKNFQVARFPMPADAQFIIQGPGIGPFSFNIPDCNHAVVYVKMINHVIKPNIEIMTFN